MKKAIALAATILVSVFSFAQNNEGARQVKVDPVQSSVEWTGKKLTGEHYGNIEMSNGQLLFRDNKLYAGSFELDMNSITCADITDEKSNTRLVDHLKSDDFFSVTKYPTSKFEITRADHKGAGKYEIEGNLTIKGITQRLSFPAVISFTDNSITASATIVFDRSKFNVQFGSQSFFENLGDKLVYDDVEMNVRIIGNLASPAPSPGN